jgi:hypothetical protein
MDEEFDLWEPYVMLNASRMICVVVVCDLEEGRQQTERINRMSFRELMKVHRLAASNVAK